MQSSILLTALILIHCMDFNMAQRKGKKWSIVSGILFLMLTSTLLPADAQDGYWIQTDNVWKYQYEDGTAPINQWVQLENGPWYYFNENGYMYTGWLCDKNYEWYYFNQDGSMATGWAQDENGTWYYFSSDGKMMTGWLQDGDVWYYLLENGTIAQDTWVDNCYLDSAGIWQADSNLEEQRSQQIADKINSLRLKYPNGLYWNHMGVDAPTNNSEIVTNIPCDHTVNWLTFCNSYASGNVIGYQCDGYARKLSDEVFGADTQMIHYEYDYDKIKVGDYLRYNNEHTVFVIGKTDEYLTVTEANVGNTCKIRWDNKISRKFLDSAIVSLFTRY